MQLRVEDSLAEGKLTAQGDLTKLARELNKFVDLDGAQLAGEMRATANWRHRGEQSAEAQAQLTLEHFQLTALGRRPWREERLIITASANGQMDSDGVLEIEEGSLRVTSANDQFDARLTGPIRMARQPLSCPFSFQLRGDLASWSDRIAPWVSVEDWRLAGTISANGSDLSTCSVMLRML